MATVLKLGFSLVFGLLTFVLPLPVGGEQFFGEWGRAALFLSLLCGLVRIGDAAEGQASQ